jgi:hypothetical protein
MQLQWFVATHLISVPPWLLVMGMSMADWAGANWKPRSSAPRPAAATASPTEAKRIYHSVHILAGNKPHPPLPHQKGYFIPLLR